MTFCSWDIETYKTNFIISARDDEGPFDYLTCDFVDAEVVLTFLQQLKSYDMHTTYNGKGFDIRVLAWIVQEYRTNPKRRYIPVREVGEEAQLYIKENNENKPRPACKSKLWSADYKLMKEIRKNHFDLMSYTIKHSLKYWELARGWSIKETSVAFDADEMTKEEILECLKYCQHDVEATWKLTHEKACLDLISARSWVISQCTDEILPDVTPAELAECYVYDGERNLFEYVTRPEDVGVSPDGKTQKILEEDCYNLVPWDSFNSPKKVKTGLQKITSGMWSGFVWNGYDVIEIKEQSSEEIKRDGINQYMRLVKSGRLESENWAAFGAGGAHFCKPKKNKLTKIFDVASLYPHIIWGFTKLKTEKALLRYVGCIQKRIELKRYKKTDPTKYSKAMDLGLKLVLNSLSGKFGSKGSKAYSPNHRLAMCIIGQLLITEATAFACGMDAEGNVNLTNCVEINTDSFAVDQPEEIERAREYCSKKQHEFFAFEEDDFPLSYWKDVNHYVVFKDMEGKEIKEIHGDDALESEPIILKSCYQNVLLNENENDKVFLIQSENIADYLVKYNRPASSKSASINGVPMDLKYYAFLWVTKDCPNAVEVRFNKDLYDSEGLISPRRAVVIMGGVNEAEKYKQYLDYEQYIEDLKHILTTWKRRDLAVELDIFGNVKKPRVPKDAVTWEQLKSKADDSAMESCMLF